MSNGKPTVNIYGVFDKELERMHDLLKYLGKGSSDNAQSNTIELYKRIKQLQDVMIKTIESNDKLIQEKVAELALMGSEEKSDGNKG